MCFLRVVGWRWGSVRGEEGVCFLRGREVEVELEE